jgi:hypothetical protein
MDLEEMLNPSNEREIIEGDTDEQIFESVMDAVRAREDMVTNAGDDIGDSGPVEPCLSINDIFLVISIISHYVDLSGDSSSRALGTALSSFSCQLRFERQESLKDTQITDFFACK